MTKWIVLHNTYDGGEVWIDMSQVRSMNRGDKPNYTLASGPLTTLSSTPPPPPIKVTYLIYGKDDWMEVSESPQEIILLAKGIAPQPNAFSLEEIEQAQDHINGNGALKKQDDNTPWKQMWATPYTPQSEKGSS